MVSNTPPEVSILIEKFNEWAEDRIVDLSHTEGNQFFSDSLRMEARGGISWLRAAKTYLKRLGEEKHAENN